MDACGGSPWSCCVFAQRIEKAVTGQMSPERSREQRRPCAVHCGHSAIRSAAKAQNHHPVLCTVDSDDEDEDENVEVPLTKIKTKQEKEKEIGTSGTEGTSPVSKIRQAVAYFLRPELAPAVVVLVLKVSAAFIERSMSSRQLIVYFEGR